MTLRQIGAVVVCAFALSMTAAEATQRQKQTHNNSANLIYCPTDQTYRQVCGGPVYRTSEPRRASVSEGSIVSHPEGCPRHLFCGCGVSVKVFGRPVRDLFLAANWLRKFPRATPGSGMVAARSGHVMYIMAYNGDGTALVYDPNSGGHKTRIHTRSLAGYRIVDPRGGRVASR